MTTRLIGLALGALAFGAAQACEDSSILVSGYASNNVHIYDACDGSFERLLDLSGRISGAQGIRERDGVLYVVSEENGRVLRYRSDTFEFVDIFIGGGDLNGVSRPTGMDFTPDGNIVLGGFGSSSVALFSGADGSFIRTVVPPGADGLAGPDAGLLVASNGLMYVPSFDSSRVLIYDLDGNYQGDLAQPPEVSQPRVVLEKDDGTLLVGSWGNGAVQQYRLADGQYLGQFAGTVSPTGLAFLGDELLTTNDLFDDVRRYNADGSFGGVFVARGAGGLDGGTFLHVIQPEPVAEPPDTELFWITAAGFVDGDSVEFEAFQTMGGQWGDAHSDETIALDPWGLIDAALSACDTIELSFASELAAYGSGVRTAQKLGEDAAQVACEDAGGPGANPDPAWFTGVWALRASEGMVLTLFTNGALGLALFSYTPNAN